MYSATSTCLKCIQKEGNLKGVSVKDSWFTLINTLGWSCDLYMNINPLT